MKIILFLVLFLGQNFILSDLFSQEEKKVEDKNAKEVAVTKDEKKADDATTPVVEEKKYTESEFQREVKRVLNEKMQEFKKGDVSDITFEVLQKEKKLIEREQKLKIKEEELSTSIKELNTQTKKFNELKSKIIGCLDENEKKMSERMDHVVSIISGMRPQKASEVLSVQDADVSVKILSQLDSVKASKIFNLMDKEISARIQKQYLDMKK